MDAAAGPEDEDRLYGLMEIAERQQAAVQAALDGLAAERVALVREREALARGVQDVQIGAQDAVQSAVVGSLAGAATEGVAAVQAATAPLLARLAGMTEQAGQADAALRDMVASASWRLLGWMMAAIASLVLFGWLATGLVLWWDTGAIAAARAQKAQLAAKVVEIQANRDEWAKAGLIAKLTRCNPGNRPCVRVDEKARAFGTESDYRVLLGYQFHQLTACPKPCCGGVPSFFAVYLQLLTSQSKAYWCAIVGTPACRGRAFTIGIFYKCVIDLFEL